MTPMNEVRTPSDSLLDQLIDAFCALPGVGQKTAARMAYHLLARDRDGGKQLAGHLSKAMQNITHCARCRNFCEHHHCKICLDTRRNPALLCIVENPADIAAIENAGSFNGSYFVLMGHLSPLDGIGPEALGLDLLQSRLATEPLEEVIIATNATVEGEATAYYLGSLVRQHNIKPSRIAHGVPKGSELEYIDTHTLSEALRARAELAVL